MYILDHKMIFHTVLNILETTFELIVPFFLNQTFFCGMFVFQKITTKKKKRIILSLDMNLLI